MKEPWQEAEEHEVTLAEEEPETFSLYLELLYVSARSLFDVHGCSRLPQSNVLPVRGTESDVNSSEEHNKLSKLYVLAEMLMDDLTKNIVLAAILDRSQEAHSDGQLYYPGPTSIQIIYDRTPEGNPARRLLVDLYTTFGDETFKLAEHPDLPKDFFFDLAVNTITKRPTLAHHNNLEAELSLSKLEVASKIKHITQSEIAIQGLRNENIRVSEELVEAEDGIQDLEFKVKKMREHVPHYVKQQLDNI